MNAENQIVTHDATEVAARTGLLEHALSGLDPLAAKFDELDEAIEALTDIGDRGIGRRARKLQFGLRNFEPSVTMIGQVKAGKTTLVNAMIGEPGLLPADVNPWTSVVTSIHLSPRQTAKSGTSSFCFFDEGEWDRLLSRGGRIGELAGRAGASEELQKVAAQLEEMRKKSKRRLGDKFELLLGQEHNYGYYDGELIQRYVCLGDDFENDHETSTAQGRFADITKSADVFIQQPEFPMGMCIRDTPGVNDTFMMREQITIRAIRDSRLCVVVLSAHQALSTVDMALVRLISNIPSRDVIIFVNRIDELPDPARQVPEIRDSIRKTLADHQGPENAEIIFGSAYWADHALRDDLENLGEASAAALLNWAEAKLTAGWAEADQRSVEEMTWELSGVPQLYGVLSDRVASGVGQEVLERVARQASNLANGLRTSSHIVNQRLTNAKVVPLNARAIPTEIDRLEQAYKARLEAEFSDMIGTFQKRLERTHRGFLDRATGSLAAHMENHGEKSVWHYDPTGLRVLLRTAFQVFSKNAHNSTRKVFMEAASEIRELYIRAFGLADGFNLEAPTVPHAPSPVLLGQTIALDLTQSWWSRWWKRRRNYKAYAQEFTNMIKAETDSMVDGLRSDYAVSIQRDAERALSEFLVSQRDILSGLSQQNDMASEDLTALGLSGETTDKLEALDDAIRVIDRHVADAAEER